VAGSITGSVSPLDDATHWPAMKCWAMVRVSGLVVRIVPQRGAGQTNRAGKKKATA
jgi:hypothetical protein